MQKGGIIRCKVKGWMHKGEHYDVEMKGWMQKGKRWLYDVQIIRCKLKGRMDKENVEMDIVHDVQIKRWMKKVVL